MGDSITKGVVLTDQDRYTVTQQSFMDMVVEKLGMDIVNCGKFGSTVSMDDKIISRHIKDILEIHYTKTLFCADG